MSQAPDPRSTTLPKLPSGWYRIALQVLAGGQLAILAADIDLESIKQSDLDGKTTGELQRLLPQATGRIYVIEGQDWSKSVEFPLVYPFPIFEQFPNGRWIVANSRSDGKGNARIIGENSQEEGRIELGDGISHIQIDSQSRIWVGWFDEGVFGNGNWKIPGLRWPPSAFGIAAFDVDDGLIVSTSIPDIADCYALNVFGDEAWACTYVGFPISRIKSDAETHWNTELAGVSALAVQNMYVLAAGGYQSEANKLVLIRLHNGRIEELGVWRMSQLPTDGKDVALMSGREDVLHLVVGQNWYRWNVHQFYLNE